MNLKTSKPTDSRLADLCATTFIQLLLNTLTRSNLHFRDDAQDEDFHAGGTGQQSYSMLQSSQPCLLKYHPLLAVLLSIQTCILMLLSLCILCSPTSAWAHLQHHALTHAPISTEVLRQAQTACCTMQQFTVLSNAPLHTSCCSCSGRV